MLQKRLVFNQRGGHFSQEMQKELCVKMYSTGPLTNELMTGGPWSGMRV